MPISSPGIGSRLSRLAGRIGRAALRLTGSEALRARARMGQRSVNTDTITADRERQERVQARERASEQERKRYAAELARWVPTPQSSNVYGFRYLVDDEVLEVRFMSRKDRRRRISHYQYYGPGVNVYRDFVAAGSKGRFVWRRLRGRYAYRRIA